MPITSKEYKRIRGKMKEEIIREFLDECQCENKVYEDEFLFATVITKYTEEQYRAYRRMITEETTHIWKCPVCGKLYRYPIVAFA